MSLPSSITFSRGQAQGVVMDFAKAGDVLSMHDHASGGAHLTAVMLGQIVVRFGDGRQSETYNAGRLVDAAWPHEIEALVDGTRIMNVLK